jgi:hypothetical protein
VDDCARQVKTKLSTNNRAHNIPSISQLGIGVGGIPVSALNDHLQAGRVMRCEATTSNTGIFCVEDDGIEGDCCCASGISLLTK